MTTAAFIVIGVLVSIIILLVAALIKIATLR